MCCYEISAQKQSGLVLHARASGRGRGRGAGVGARRRQRGLGLQLRQAEGIHAARGGRAVRRRPSAASPARPGATVVEGRRCKHNDILIKGCY